MYDVVNVNATMPENDVRCVSQRAENLMQRTESLPKARRMRFLQLNETTVRMEI